MKFSDITNQKSIIDEAPVGLGARLKTKMKKLVPGGTREEAKGEEIIQKAANRAGMLFRKWAGQSGVSTKAMSPEDLLSFFNTIGWGETAKKLIQQELNKPVKEADGDAEQPANTKKADGSAPRTFNRKQAEELILKVAQTISKNNPEGMEEWEASRKEAQPAPAMQDKADTEFEAPAGPAYTPEEVVGALEAFTDGLIDGINDAVRGSDNEDAKLVAKNIEDVIKKKFSQYKKSMANNS